MTKPSYLALFKLLLAMTEFVSIARFGDRGPAVQTGHNGTECAPGRATPHGETEQT